MASTSLLACVAGENHISDNHDLPNYQSNDEQNEQETIQSDQDKSSKGKATKKQGSRAKTHGGSKNKDTSVDKSYKGKGTKKPRNSTGTGGRSKKKNISKDSSKDEYWKYIPLHIAALEGDWGSAKRFFKENEDAITAPITPLYETALHIAVQAGNKAIHFVENLVKEMPVKALGRSNYYQNTALNFAAIVGNTPAARILVEKHSQSLYIPNRYNLLPVHVAAQFDHKDTFKYLLSVTENKHDHVLPFGDSVGVRFIRQVIFSGYYEKALDLICLYPLLAKSKIHDDDSALSAIALKVSAFPSGSSLSCWKRLICYYLPVKLESHANDNSKADIENPGSSSSISANSCITWLTVSQRLRTMLWKVVVFLVPCLKHIREEKLMHLQALKLMEVLCKEIKSLNDCKAYESILKGPLFTAARLGIHEVVEQILDSFPSAVWFADNERHFVFELAILHRQANVFNIIYEMPLCKYLLSQRTDPSKNNILHLAGRLALPDRLNLIPGAALQMQGELQWFKEVEKFVQHQNKVEKNIKKETPEMLFTNQHKELVSEGEKWMKDTANSSTIVASLIATIAFAASITGPGGNDNNSGLPIFSKTKAFIIFAISNALSLFASATSLLMFLSILTSRYAEGDFLHVLPKRLIIGLVTLFLSITTMMVAFTAALYLVSGRYKEWILIPTAVAASFPIYIFMSLQFPLLVELISKTYFTIFGKKNHRHITIWKIS